MCVYYLGDKLCVEYVLFFVLVVSSNVFLYKKEHLFEYKNNTKTKRMQLEKQTNVRTMPEQMNIACNYKTSVL